MDKNTTGFELEWQLVAQIREETEIKQQAEMNTEKIEKETELNERQRWEAVEGRGGRERDEGKRALLFCW